MAAMKAFKPVNIGDHGRRGMAWLLRDGLAVFATDRDVAGHAVAGTGIAGGVE